MGDVDEGEASDRLQITALAERLRLAVRAADGPEAVAEKSGVALRTLHSYMSGGPDPKVFKLARIADACNVTVDALIGRKLQAETAENSISSNTVAMRGSTSPGEAQDDPAEDVVKLEGYIPIRRLDVRASAGAGRAIVPSDLEVGHIALRETFLRSLGVRPDFAEFATAEGDSMFPTIHDGDLLLIDRQIDRIINGMIYVVVLSGNVFVKRIQLMIDGSACLISDNPRYAPETVLSHDIDQMQVQGRVRWYGRVM